MRNVVLVCLDSVRRDFFDRYAPRLAERAQYSYSQCRAASSWSTPSHASMFTGTLPSEHGVHTHAPAFSGLGRADTFLDGLPAHTAIGVSANEYASSSFGFDGLFDEFVDVTPECRFPAGLDPGAFFADSARTGPSLYAAYLRAAASHDAPLRSLANGALARLDSASKGLPVPKLLDDGAAVVSRAALDAVDRVEEPYFLFANVMDAHVPHRATRGYDPRLYSASDAWDSTALDNWAVNLEGARSEHAGDVERFRELYAAAIDYLDRRISRLVDRLQARSELETTVVVTADHGENLAFPADDGLVGHKGSLSEGLLHVPLLVIDPPWSTVGPTGVYEAADYGYVSHLALGRLLVGLAEECLPDVTAERVPAELVGIGTTVGPLAEPGNEAAYARWNRMIRCVYDGERKYVWDSLGDSSVARLDPERPSWQERVATDVEVPVWARGRFSTDVEAYKRRAAEAGDGPRRFLESIDEEARNRLADLGYL